MAMEGQRACDLADLTAEQRSILWMHDINPEAIRTGNEARTLEFYFLDYNAGLEGETQQVKLPLGKLLK